MRTSWSHVNNENGGGDENNTTPLNLNEEDFVSINVCGMNYETLKSTLDRFPATLLGNPEHRLKYYVKSKNSYFFDRHRQCFEAILYYYQSGGLLLRPPNIPMHLFADEVNFFCIGKDTLQALQKDEGYFPDESEEEHREMPKSVFQRKVWELFEYPDSSLAARVLASWSILVIAVSIVVFCMETIPDFRPPKHDKSANNSNQSAYQSDSYVQPWFSLELACIIWFTIEYAVRLISSPNKWTFLMSFLNIIDLLAILPYFIILPINSGDTTPLSVLRVARLVRVFRIFKLSRHSLGLQILGHTLRASVSELGMLIFFMILWVILFSSAIYYAEKGGDSDMFKCIPDAFWYTLVTMTTVGYGDKVPQTLWGKLVGSACVVSGVLTVALPVPVIVSNFEFFYKRDRLYNNKKKLLATPVTGDAGDDNTTENQNGDAQRLLTNKTPM